MGGAPKVLAFPQEGAACQASHSPSLSRVPNHPGPGLLEPHRLDSTPGAEGRATPVRGGSETYSVPVPAGGGGLGPSLAL